MGGQEAIRHQSYAQGQVIIEDKPTVLTTDISCEFRCRQALQRRSLALDQADLMGYHVLESYHNLCSVC